MSIESITLLLIGSLVLLLIIGMPMAFSLGIVGVGFTFAFFGWDALSLISSRIYGFINVYVLVAVPMFLLMASIMDKSGVARDLYNALRVWSGRLPGGDDLDCRSLHGRDHRHHRGRNHSARPRCIAADAASGL